MSGVDTRNISRDSLFLLADLRLEGVQSQYRVKVRNLSGGGMMAEGVMPVVPGNRLQISLRNIGWIGGTVAWVQDNCFGIAFDREIDPKLVRAPNGSLVEGASEQEQFLRSHGAKPGHGYESLTKFRKV